MKRVDGVLKELHYKETSSAFPRDCCYTGYVYESVVSHMCASLVKSQSSSSYFRVYLCRVLLWECCRVRTFVWLICKIKWLRKSKKL